MAIELTYHDEAFGVYIYKGELANGVAYIQTPFKATLPDQTHIADIFANHPAILIRPNTMTSIELSEKFTESLNMKYCFKSDGRFKKVLAVIGDKQVSVFTWQVLHDITKNTVLWRKITSFDDNTVTLASGMGKTTVVPSEIITFKVNDRPYHFRFKGHVFDDGGNIYPPKVVGDNEIRFDIDGEEVTLKDILMYPMRKFQL